MMDRESRHAAARWEALKGEQIKNLEQKIEIWWGKIMCCGRRRNHTLWPVRCPSCDNCVAGYLWAVIDCGDQEIVECEFLWVVERWKPCV